MKTDSKKLYGLPSVSPYEHVPEILPKKNKKPLNQQGHGCVYTGRILTQGAYKGRIHGVYTRGVYIGCIHGVYTLGVYMGRIHGVYARGVYMGRIHGAKATTNTIKMVECYHEIALVFV